ncbi:MAG: rod shape-determining protein MreC [Chitinophagaceae bacterium]|nr:rod shape-determining protein MreC [Chitinophagaceae bacterium]
MRNIFLFIRRFSTAIFFVALQALALWFLITYNKFYRAKGLGVANEVTGWFNSRYNTAEDFFKMREENRKVHKLNDSLMNLLSVNFIRNDTASRLTTDSIPFDTLGHYRRYRWRNAQVTYGTVNAEKNYIQINKGSKDGIYDDMGVFSSDGSLVGTVINVSPNFSQVMSLLHVQNKTSVLVKKTRSSGAVSWNGKDPQFLILSNIPKSDSIVKGDTIVTGNYILSIPPGMMVGTVAEIVPDNSTNFYVLKIRTAANFADLQQVFVVENLQYPEQESLLKATQKKVDDPKRTNR